MYLLFLSIFLPFLNFQGLGLDSSVDQNLEGFCLSQGVSEVSVENFAMPSLKTHLLRIAGAMLSLAPAHTAAAKYMLVL